MYKVTDQWDCVVAEFEEREDALAYIAQREKAYANTPCGVPRFYIKEE